jgi:hypothetical protein
VSHLEGINIAKQPDGTVAVDLSPATSARMCGSVVQAFGLTIFRETLATIWIRNCSSPV